MGMSRESLYSQFPDSLAEKSPNVGVTPFLRHMREMSEYFKSFKNQTEKLEQFSRCKNNAERIDLVLRAISSSEKFRSVDFLFQDVKAKRNDPDESKRLRDSGNRLYKRKDFKGALKTYTAAALVVNIDSDGKCKEIALALGNRSAVYFQMKEFEKCLDDLEAALMFGYPESLQYKIFDRKGRSLWELGKEYEAQESLEMASIMIQKSSLSEEEKLKLRLEMKSSLMRPSEVREPRSASVPVLTSHHPSVSGLSGCCEVRHERERGRHCLARTDCQPGQLVASDLAATWCLSHNYAGLHCHHCCGALAGAGIPSPLNSRETVLFCSLHCLTGATSTYHRVEASVPLSHIFSVADSGGYDEISGAVMMVIRAVTQQPCSLLTSDLLEDARADIVTDTSQQDGLHRLRSLLNMVTHHSDRSEVDLLSLTMKTCFILQLLSKMNYWAADEDRDTLAPVIFHLLEVVQYNSHPLDKVVGNIDPYKNLNLVDIGSGVFPTVARCLNHSCDPSTLRVVRGNKIFLFARRFIRKGDELTDCYGFHYTSLGLTERRRRLKKWFNFSCCCVACQESFPVMDRLSNKLTKTTMDQLRHLLEKFQSALKDNQVDF